MRVVITALASAAVVALAFTAGADAATASKKKKSQATSKERVQPPRDRPDSGEVFGYDSSPDHHRFGSREWWRAMEREGRGGFGDTM